MAKINKILEIFRFLFSKKNYKKTIIVLVIFLTFVIMSLNFRCEVSKSNFILGCEPPEKTITIEKKK